MKVVLSGEGADEVFGGYSRYRRAGLLGALAGRSRTRGVFRGPLAAAPALRGWRDGLARAEAAQALAGRSTMQKLQAIDCAEWLPNDLLVKLDRCLMAHSLEGRTPYLDPVVADFAFRLPDRAKVRGGLGKWLLREWLARNVPAAEPFARKQGFNPPIGRLDRRPRRLASPTLSPVSRAWRNSCRPTRCGPCSATPPGTASRPGAWSSTPCGTAITCSASRQTARSRTCSPPPTGSAEASRRRVGRSALPLAEGEGWLRLLPL